MTPRTNLARAFARIEQAEIPSIAAKAGVSARQVSNLIVGRPVKTIAFLRLCVALGHDPLPHLPHSPLARPADFDFAMLAMGCVIRRGLNKHTIRDAADAMGISHVTVSRIENAHGMSIAVVLAVCRYVQVHPFNYLAIEKMSHSGTAVVSREKHAAAR